MTASSWQASSAERIPGLVNKAVSRLRAFAHGGSNWSSNKAMSDETIKVEELLWGLAEFLGRLDADQMLIFLVDTGHAKITPVVGGPNKYELTAKGEKLIRRALRF